MPVTLSPSERDSITIRIGIRNKPGMLGKRTTATGDAAGDICAVDMSGVEG